MELQRVANEVELSEVQKGIYFDCQIADPASYNLLASFMIDVVEDLRLQQACEILIAEQEALRYCVKIIDGVPKLILHEEINFLIQFQEARAVYSTDKDWIQNLIAKEAQQAFDLQQPPLFAIRCLRIENHRCLLLIKIHHIICDGLSLDILKNKLLAYYQQLIQGDAIALSTDSGFSAFLLRENQRLNTGVYSKQKAFWHEHMKDLPLITLTESLKTRPLGSTGIETRFMIPQELEVLIEQICSQQEVSSFIYFLATFSMLLSFYLDNKDVVVSSPFNYRPTLQCENSIGCFIHTLPLRFKIEPKATLGEILTKTAQEFLVAYKNIAYPNNLIIRDSMSLSSASAHSYSGVLFVSDIYEEQAIDAQFNLTLIEQDEVPFPGSLMVSLNKRGENYWIKLQSKSEIFTPELISQFEQHYLWLLYEFTQFKQSVAEVNARFSEKPQIIKWPFVCQTPQDKKTRSSPAIADSSLDQSGSSLSVLEQQILVIWQSVLKVKLIELDDDFFDFGSHSLALIQVNHQLKEALGIEISIRTHFEYSTIRSLAKRLVNDLKSELPEQTKEKNTVQEETPENLASIKPDIAVIGMAMHGPGAENIDDFWKNLKNGTESILFYSDEELKKLGISEELLNSKHYVKAVGRVSGADYFDPQFFAYTPGEVSLMSPQFRLMIKTVWEALENAGYFIGKDASRTGLFLSGSDDFEWFNRVLFQQENFADQFQVFTLSSNQFLATRIANKLNIAGPAFTVSTACSSSLVACHLALQSLLLKECDLAIAGGVTVELPNEGGYSFVPGMMMSDDGHVCPFDANATGTLFSNGSGIVVLKRLDQAIKDGDQIYAIIKGSAINNDGSFKSAFSAPSVVGQTEVIKLAHQSAGIPVETISYVEAHGTGTLLGDPIEVEALTQAFATSKKQFCTLGSLKGNIGHTDSAAGVIGLIKVALSLTHCYLPATLNYQSPNPEINFEKTPFTVHPQGRPWVASDDNIPRRAGLNSFGVGGTNAHMVLEEAPNNPTDSVSTYNLLVFSAQNARSLDRIVSKTIEAIGHDTNKLSDVAWTLQTGRKSWPVRQCLVINRDSFEQSSELVNLSIQRMNTKIRPIYFMFSGQGTQYQGMGRELFLSKEFGGVAPIFNQYVKEIFDFLSKEKRSEITDIIYGEKNPEQIHNTEHAQLSLFINGYALGRTLLDLGVMPAGMIGHSIGEITAATLAGVFDLQTAVNLVLTRGKLMQQQKRGAMLLVMATANLIIKEIAHYSDLWLALDNTTESCVVAGTVEAISEFKQQIEKLGWQSIILKTSHAFHTPMMGEAVKAFDLH
ncbi:MAG: acyltransferase domain-containing protein [Tatlockia sp.]|nr:acyltransferase domain-containing protein [Tatlockia sp.]